VQLSPVVNTGRQTDKILEWNSEQHVYK
jgi:hypothetical protein